MNFCLLFTCICAVFLQFVTLFTFSTTVPILPDDTGLCLNETCGLEFNPTTALIKCQYVPDEFMECELPPLDLNGNKTAKDEKGYGCLKFGSQKYDEVERSHVWCRVLDDIECYGDRDFLSLKQHPCIKYTGHYFVTTLMYSVLLGILGMDRFCLGHTGTAVGKLLTIGGFGVWWLVDIVLLVLGALKPADDSNWMPYY